MLINDKSQLKRNVEQIGLRFSHHEIGVQLALKTNKSLSWSDRLVLRLFHTVGPATEKARSPKSKLQTRAFQFRKKRWDCLDHPRTRYASAIIVNTVMSDDDRRLSKLETKRAQRQHLIDQWWRMTDVHCIVITQPDTLPIYCTDGRN